MLGAAVAWLYARSRGAAASRELEKALEVNKEKLNIASSSLIEAQNRLDEERSIVSELNQKLAVAGEREKSMQEKYEQYQKEVDKLQEKFKLEFENIATKILKQNTLDFSENNQIFRWGILICVVYVRAVLFRKICQIGLGFRLEFNDVVGFIESLKEEILV